MTWIAHGSLATTGKNLTSSSVKSLRLLTGTRGSSKKSYFFADGGFNAVRNCEAGLFFDSARSRRDRAQPAAQEQSARSFRFGFSDLPGEHPIDLPGFLRRGRVARCRV